MNKYLEAEQRLAELLHIEGDLSPATLDEIGCSWCHGDAAAFRLMVEHDVCLHQDGGSATAEIEAARIHSAVAHFFQHTDKATAVRYAIVQAVIAKLEGEKS